MLNFVRRWLDQSARPIHRTALCSLACPVCLQTIIGDLMIARLIWPFRFDHTGAA